MPTYLLVIILIATHIVCFAAGIWFCVSVEEAEREIEEEHKRDYRY